MLVFKFQKEIIIYNNFILWNVKMASKKQASSHPGEILLNDYLNPLGLTQKQFAEHLGWTYPRLNEIINMRRGITADSALAFAEAFGTAPEFWLHLQASWDLSQARKKHFKVKLISKIKK